ncbi:MAG: hypothetical protein AAF196_12885 [Planctomycetota bacterium]
MYSSRSRTLRGASLLGLLLFATLAAAPSTAQEKKQKPKWPKLSRTERTTLDRSHTAYAKADEAEDADAVRAEHFDRMVEVGAGAARWAFRKLENDRVVEPEMLVELCRRVVSEDYTPLVADELVDRKAPLHVRRFAAEFVSQRQDEGWTEALTTGFEVDDERVRFFSATGLFVLGDFTKLAPIFEAAKTDWSRDQNYLEHLLPSVRGEDAFETLDDGLGSDRERDEVTALRLARFLAPESVKLRIGLLLDSDRHNVKKEAINALRVIVDGKEPLENLDVFKAIQFANEWKARLQ